MFVDRVVITARSGDGGDGASAFRREIYVPEGGPSGGDGGKGGDVYVVADNNVHTLMDYRFRKNYKAENGGKGDKKNMHGRGGEDLILKVPPGTVVYDDASGLVLADVVSPGDTMLLVKGGQGGRGNARFATATRQAPIDAEKGRPGRELSLRLELKSIADVGLVGFPNAGKSTLLASVSRARPKVANYPFTTLEPNLGVVSVDGRSFVMADIPGLIEGASAGQGLGHTFLRHVERTRVIIHVVDAAGTEGRDPLADIQIIDNELAEYSQTLADRPQIVALNKVDAVTEDADLVRIEQALSEQNREFYRISAVTGEGIQALLHHAMDLVELTPALPLHEISIPDEADALEPLSVEHSEEGFVVRGTRIENLISRTNLDNHEAVQRLQVAMTHMGVFQALRDAGIKEGDQVFIGEVSFSFYDEMPE
ncbi:MAG TPA: GTPase ObgE [Bacillota bacterium]|nr:GTPase ObgE [Bacillota bacterium]